MLCLFMNWVSDQAPLVLACTDSPGAVTAFGLRVWFLVVAVVDAIISVNALNASNRICQCIECKWHEGVFAVVDAGVSGNALHARWPCYAREGLVWWEEMPEK